MPKHQTIDLPKLPSFDVSNTSSSITDRFVYGDRLMVKKSPRREVSSDPYNIEFSRSDLQNVIHIITAELKSKGSKTPFIFLPFRAENDEYKLKQFLTRIINDSEFVDAEILVSVVKRTDEFTLISSLKFFWCRLPGGAIISWKSYNKFARLEKEKGYPKKAFLSIMPYCLSSAAHASIVYDFLDLLVSAASYTKDNKLSGRKICKMCGIWAFNGSSKKSSSKKNPSFASGLDDWVPASDALFHVMLAFLRSILPEDEKNKKQLPKTLQSLISSNAYPPAKTKHSDPSHLLEVPIITLCVNSPSKTPMELISKISKTLTFDNAKLFYSRDDYILLKSLFNDDSHLINMLSPANKKIMDRICQSDEIDLTVNEPLVKFKLVPGWSDDLVTFDNQEPVPASEEFFTANVSKTLIDDYFIWTWLSTIGPEETNIKRKIFGKTFILEVELSESYKKWVIVEEQDINSQSVDDDGSDGDMELELKLQRLRKQEAELLERKAKKNSKQDLPPIPIAKESKDTSVIKNRKLRKLDESSKKFQGKLASSLRKFSNGDNRRHQTPETKPLPAIIDDNPLPRDRSEHNFKLPEFEDDDDDLADDFEQYLQKSTVSETRPLQIKQRTPSPERSPLRNGNNYHSPIQTVDNATAQNQYNQQAASNRQAMVSVYGIEQLQQYSPYINYDDGQFPSLSPQKSTFEELREEEKRYSRSPERPSDAYMQQQQHYQYQNQQQQEQQQQVYELAIPADQTSGGSSRLRRKPPPSAEQDPNLLVPTDRPHSQYSEKPITPSASHQPLRPISQYSSNSYANSFAPPTPEHQLLNSQSPHHSPSPPHPQQAQPAYQYQYRSMIPPSTSPQHAQPQQQPQQQLSVPVQTRDSPSPTRPLQQGNYQYRSMLSPVERNFPNVEDKSLPPSPKKLGQPVELAYSPATSPVKSIPQSPSRSNNEQVTMYGSASASPSKSLTSPSRSVASPGAYDSALPREMSGEFDKPLPPSPVKSMASTALPSPSKNSLYGASSASPSKNSLYGDSKADLLEDGKRESTYHSLTNEIQGVTAPKAPKDQRNSRTSAIIENFDMLENELQDFLNDDTRSMDSAESFKTGVDDREGYLSPALTDDIQQGKPVQFRDASASPDKSLNSRSPPNSAPHQRVPPPAPGNPQFAPPVEQQQQQQQQYQYEQAPPSQQFQTPPPTQRIEPPPQESHHHPAHPSAYYPQQGALGPAAGVQYQQAMYAPQAPGQYHGRRGSRSQEHVAPAPVSYPVPNGSDPSLSSHGSSYHSDNSSGAQYNRQYPPQQQQQYQQGPPPHDGYGPRHGSHHANYVSPNNSYDQLQIPQNGYPVVDRQGQPPLRGNAHSPARPSNLGPNYQQGPPPQQRVSPHYYSGPQQSGARISPPYGNAPPPQARGRPPQQGIPYGAPPPQQYYPVTPQKQQYYQHPNLPPHPDQRGSRTPHHPGTASFSPNPSHSPRSFNGNPMTPPQGQQFPAVTRSDYTIQQMPAGQKLNKLHGHSDNRNTKKNLRDAIATGGFGI